MPAQPRDQLQPELYSKLNALCSTFGTQASARAAVACCAASKVSPREIAVAAGAARCAKLICRSAKSGIDSLKMSPKEKSHEDLIGRCFVRPHALSHRLFDEFARGPRDIDGASQTPSTLVGGPCRLRQQEQRSRRRSDAPLGSSQF